MRTKTTRQLEAMTFEKLSDWSIVAGAIGTLYSRHKESILITAVALEFAVIIWIKLA